MSFPFSYISREKSLRPTGRGCNMIPTYGLASLTFFFTRRGWFYQVRRVRQRKKARWVLGWLTGEDGMSPEIWLVIRGWMDGCMVPCVFNLGQKVNNVVSTSKSNGIPFFSLVFRLCTSFLVFYTLAVWIMLSSFSTFLCLGLVMDRAAVFEGGEIMACKRNAEDGEGRGGQRVQMRERRTCTITKIFCLITVLSLDQPIGWPWSNGLRRLLVLEIKLSLITPNL